MSNLSRRTFVGVALAAPLAACAVSSSNGVTTITVNVAEITSDGNVAVQVLEALLGLSGLPATIVSAITTGVNTIEADVAAVTTGAAGSETYTFNTTSVPAFLSSLVSDVQEAGANLANVVNEVVSSSLASQIQSVASDVEAVASVIASIWTNTVSASPTESAAQHRADKIAIIKARHGLK
jgi:hypothetical protein